MKGLYILGEAAYERIYPSTIREQIEQSVHIYAPLQTKDSIKEDLSLLKEADVIFSGWGGPRMDSAFLEAAPNLKAVFYGAGSVKPIVTDAFWEKNIRLTSSYAANAMPVAEFALSQILFTLKCGYHFIEQYKATKDKSTARQIYYEVPGAYGSTVGIISFGMIGRRVCELLQSFDVKVIAYDPFVSQEEANHLNVELCSLEDVFRSADVISLHTPWLKETEGMITGAHFASMKPRAAFINTSRGAVIRENEMIEVLQNRSDLQVVLDVTYPEPPVPESPLFALPNVVLTPHIAGSLASECHRMGSYVVEELHRFITGEPAKWEITEERFKTMA